MRVKYKANLITNESFKTPKGKGEPKGEPKGKGKSKKGKDNVHLVDQSGTNPAPKLRLKPKSNLLPERKESIPFRN